MGMSTSIISNLQKQYYYQFFVRATDCREQRSERAMVVIKLLKQEGDAVPEVGTDDDVDDDSMFWAGVKKGVLIILWFYSSGSTIAAM